MLFPNFSSAEGNPTAYVLESVLFKVAETLEVIAVLQISFFFSFNFSHGCGTHTCAYLDVRVQSWESFLKNHLPVSVVESLVDSITVCVRAWAGWLASPREPPVSASLALGLQVP